MEVILAKSAGFCFGVQRAVDMVYAQIGHSEKPVFTFGPIVHNDEVVKDLEKKGVKVLPDLDALRALKKGTVVIRAHGAGKEVYDALSQSGVAVADATCPFVRKIHKAVQREQAKGRRIVIIGDPKHPEVQGICSWADGRALVVQEGADVEKLPFFGEEPISIVAQTTFNYNKFQELVEKFLKKGYDINVLNTICNATQERQAEARRIASKVDAMIVIGGRHSSNSRKLYEICQKECRNTYFIQTLDDFNPECVNSVRSVGITAGASAPKQIIEEVHAKCQNKALNKCWKSL